MSLMKQDIATIRMLLEGLEQRIDGKLTGMEQRYDGKLEGMEQRFDGKLVELDQRIDEKFVAHDTRWEARMNEKIYELKLELFAKIDESTQQTLVECELEHELLAKRLEYLATQARK